MDANKYIMEKYGVSGKPPLRLSIGRLNEFIKLLGELGYKVGAEIGVLGGEYTELLCKHGMRMYGIDPWMQYDEYYDYAGKSLSKYEEEARRRLAPYDCTLIKATSMEAVKQFADESLDFVYIDGNHEFRHVTDDIDEWSRKVRKGGIVAGHDFQRMRGRNLMHVKDVVESWTYAHGINPWFITTRDRYPSWFWVK